MYDICKIKFENSDLLSYSIDGYPQSISFYVDNVYQLHIELNRDDSYHRIDRDSLKIIGNVFEDLY